jgi:hypothetical protein
MGSITWGEIQYQREGQQQQQGVTLRKIDNKEPHDAEEEQ